MINAKETAFKHKAANPPNELLAQGKNMAARKWTLEQRAAQSKAIHTWRPWKQSTGAKSATGKAIASRNAYRGGTRQLSRFSRWFYQAIKNPETLTPEIVEAAKNQSITLLCSNTEYMAASIAKLIEKHNFTEGEVTDLQVLVKWQEDFKSSLMQS